MFNIRLSLLYYVFELFPKSTPCIRVDILSFRSLIVDSLNPNRKIYLNAKTTRFFSTMYYIGMKNCINKARNILVKVFSWHIAEILLTYCFRNISRMIFFIVYIVKTIACIVKTKDKLPVWNKYILNYYC